MGRCRGAGRREVKEKVGGGGVGVGGRFTLHSPYFSQENLCLPC